MFDEGPLMEFALNPINPGFTAAVRILWNYYVTFILLIAEMALFKFIV